MHLRELASQFAHKLPQHINSINLTLRHDFEMALTANLLRTTQAASPSPQGCWSDGGRKLVLRIAEIKVWRLITEPSCFVRQLFRDGREPMSAQTLGR